MPLPVRPHNREVLSGRTRGSRAGGGKGIRPGIHDLHDVIEIGGVRDVQDDRFGSQVQKGLRVQRVVVGAPDGGVVRRQQLAGVCEPVHRVQLPGLQHGLSREFFQHKRITVDVCLSGSFKGGGFMRGTSRCVLR